MAYTRVNWENFPSTATPRNATNLNVMDAGIDDVDARLTTAEGEIDNLQTDVDNLQTGWNSAGETWTYSSVDDPTGVITISGNVTTKYSLGMRIKFTNATNVIYGIITAISYSSPNTTLTFLHEINPSTSQALHLMTNSAITNNYYSNMKVPYGFPIEEDKWSVYKNIASNLSLNNPIDDADYNINNLFLSVPIGEFKIKLLFSGLIFKGDTGDNLCIVGLSTDGNMSNAICSARIYAYSQSHGYSVYLEKQENLTQKTNIYLLLRFSGSLLITRIYKNDTTDPSIPLTFQFKAVCAYL